MLEGISNQIQYLYSNPIEWNEISLAREKTTGPAYMSN